MAVGSGKSARAQGGPPFRTDDPETPGNQHWEINFGWTGDRGRAYGAYQVPDFDFNYGLGDRLQLKYELPIALEETQGPQGNVVGGLGESLLGVKWRFFEHGTEGGWGWNEFGTGLRSVWAKRAAPAAVAGDAPGAKDAAVPRFSVSSYPQLFVDNPTRAVARGVVAAGPNFYLPLEVNGRAGPIRMDGEVGYNFGNRSLPQSWGRGLLVGHEFSDRLEIYAELYDLQEANRLPAGRGVGAFGTGGSKQRETTLGLGGRQVLNRAKTLNLLLMAGRSFQTIALSNSQPEWIAYVGLQVLLGPR